jgi:hypothetical protein
MKLELLERELPQNNVQRLVKELLLLRSDQ